MTWDDSVLRWDTDYRSTGGGVGGRPARSRSTRAPVERYTASQTLTTASLAYPETVERAREKLKRTVDAWTEANGYVITGIHLSTDPPTAASATVEMRLTAEITPRTDGEWPAIRKAIQEDQADREALKLPASLDRSTEAFRRFSDRMDALAASAAVWSARTPDDAREALRRA